jgi:hypothetical protein
MDAQPLRCQRARFPKSSGQWLKFSGMFGGGTADIVQRSDDEFQGDGAPDKGD